MRELRTSLHKTTLFFFFFLVQPCKESCLSLGCSVQIQCKMTSCSFPAWHEEGILSSLWLLRGCGISLICFPSHYLQLWFSLCPLITSHFLPMLFHPLARLYTRSCLFSFSPPAPQKVSFPLLMPNGVASSPRVVLILFLWDKWISAVLEPTFLLLSVRLYTSLKAFKFQFCC